MKPGEGATRAPPQAASYRQMNERLAQRRGAVSPSIKIHVRHVFDEANELDDGIVKTAEPEKLSKLREPVSLEGRGCSPAHRGLDHSQRFRFRRRTAAIWSGPGLELSALNFARYIFFISLLSRIRRSPTPLTQGQRICERFQVSVFTAGIYRANVGHAANLRQSTTTCAASTGHSPPSAAGGGEQGGRGTEVWSAPGVVLFARRGLRQNIEDRS